jgi:pyrroloquinoline quinone biosynthesis protein B
MAILLMRDLPADGVYLLVLGIAQDAGLPHAGCLCPRCAAALTDPSLAEYAAALAIVDARQQSSAVWLIDATPDIKFQLNYLADVLGPHSTMPGRIRQPDGLFLTHAHMGHTAGLVHLGPEGMNVQNLPLYASPGLIRALRETRLWRPLIGNLDFRPLSPDLPLELAAQLTIRPIVVPHRDELHVGTLAFEIRGPVASCLYVPDIDNWALWPAARDVIAGVDWVLADASFYSAGELGGREPVAHPLVPETLDFFEDLPVRLLLTHLNHTNPLLDDHDPARLALAGQGASVAYMGQVIAL